MSVPVSLRGMLRLILYAESTLLVFSWDGSYIILMIVFPIALVRVNHTGSDKG